MNTLAVLLGALAAHYGSATDYDVRARIKSEERVSQVRIVASRPAMFYTTERVTWPDRYEIVTAIKDGTGVAYLPHRKLYTTIRPGASGERE